MDHVPPALTMCVASSEVMDHVPAALTMRAASSEVMDHVPPALTMCAASSEVMDQEVIDHSAAIYSDITTTLPKLRLLPRYSCALAISDRSNTFSGLQSTLCVST